MLDVLLRTIHYIPMLGTHSIQVGFLASKIAEALQLDETEAFLAGMLHDIGIVTPHKNIALDDVDYEFFLGQDVLILDHTLVSAFEVSKISKLVKRYPELTDAIILHHTPSERLNPSKRSDVLANVLSAADHVSKFVMANTEELGFEDYRSALTANSGKFFDFVLQATLKTVQVEYNRWVLSDLKAGYTKEELISSYVTDKTYDLQDAIEVGAIISYIVDSKSKFTREHSWRVAKVAAAMSREILADEKQMFIAGLFHDIGKIKVPICVLEKQGKLDLFELDVMRKHSFYSYLILLDHSSCPWFLPAVRHQERVDGSGYPWHLSGDRMSFLDKIMQVADYFVAVLEPRPYRGPNTPGQAYAEVRKAVADGKLDGSAAKILGELIYGGFDFESINLMNQIQADIEAFERSLS